MESNLNLDRHISGKFNEDLDRVKTKLLEMGGLVERQISDSITALLEGNTSLAHHAQDALDLGHCLINQSRIHVNSSD